MPLACRLLHPLRRLDIVALHAVALGVAITYGILRGGMTLHGGHLVPSRRHLDILLETQSAVVAIGHGILGGRVALFRPLHQFHHVDGALGLCE